MIVWTAVSGLYEDNDPDCVGVSVATTRQGAVDALLAAYPDYDADETGNTPHDSLEKLDGWVWYHIDEKEVIT